MARKKNDKETASGHSPGKQQHAEGQHGDKTHERLLESLHGKQLSDDEVQAEAAEATGRKDFDAFGQPKPGHHRLTEDRQQHDPAEKDSEINRLSR